MEPGVDERIAVIARTQHGLATAAQLRAAGLTADGLRTRVAAHRLVRLQPGVFAVGGVPRSAERDLLAAALAAPGALASHRSAARLWDLDLYPDDGAIDVTVPRGTSARLQGVVVHRPLDPAAPVVRRGVPSTNPMRTIIDLGAVVEFSSVRHAVDVAIAARLVTVRGLQATLFDLARQGRSGCAALRAVLDEYDPDERAHDSVLERRMRRLARAHGLPEPVFQLVVRNGAGRFLGRVDFAWPSVRLAVEVLGYGPHSAHDAWTNDIQRRRRLTSEGWTVLEFTRDEIHHTPERVISDVRP